MRPNILGNHLKSLRKDKGLTLKQISSGIATPQMISKFERGEANITVDKFFALMNRLNASHEDLLIIYSLFQPAQWSVMKIISDAILTKNADAFQDLYDKEGGLFKKDGNVRHLHNQILAQSHFNQICGINQSEEELQIIKRYLFNIDNWGYYEVSLFNNFLKYLDIRTVKHLYPIMVKKSHKYARFSKYRSDFVHLLLNIVLKLIENKEYKAIPKILNQIEELIKNTALLYENTRLNYLKGLYLIATGEVDKGKQLSEEAIEILRKLNWDIKAEAVQDELDKILQQHSTKY